MPLNDYQFSIGSLVLGPGTNYTVADWDGYGVPSFRTSDDPFPLEHGSTVGPEYLNSRDINLDIVVRGSSPTNAVLNAEAFIAAWYLDSTLDGFNARKPLTLKLPGQDERMLLGRPRRAEINPRRFVGSNASITASFFAPDPRWLSTSLFSQVLNLGAPVTGGRGYNHGYNYGYGGAAAAPTVSIVNGGGISSRPTVRFNGPLLNPTIINETTGRSLQLVLTIASSTYIDVDFAAKTVLLGGTSSRYFAKVGDFWDLLPGSNLIRLNSASYNPSATATISWRSTWL